MNIGFGMETLKNFGLKTSVKGIPRAVKSTSRTLRILWSVSVIGFLAAACFQSYILTKEYLAFTSTTALTEYNVELLGLTERSVQLPDISVCNTNPFGSNIDKIQDVPTLKEFYERVSNITLCDECSSLQKQKMDSVRKYLLSAAVYADFIGPDNVLKVGHSLDSMLVDCQLIYIEGRVFQQKPCIPGTQFIYRYDVNFYNCYTLRLPTPSLTGNIYIGVSLVFHLDNFHQDHLIYFDKTNIRNRMVGIELNLHRPNTMLSVDFDSMFLPPGFLGNLKFRFERRIRLPHPHGTCSDHMEDTYGADRRHTITSCFASCIQAHIADVCHCSDINPYANMNRQYGNLTKCFHIDRGSEDLLQMWECVVRERRAAMLPCSENCINACDELTYNTQVGGYIKTRPSLRTLNMSIFQSDRM